MKQIIYSMVALSLVTSVAQARPFDEIISSGVLKVGVPADYAPLAFFNEEDRLVGFDVDMAKSLSKQLGIKTQFVITSWPTLSKDLAADRFDIAMGGVTYTEKRAEQFLLSDAVLPNGKIALAACNSAGKLSNLEKIDIPSTRLVVNPGGTNESFVNENIHKANIIRVKDNFDNIQALREQSADMMVTDLIEGNYYEYKEPGVLCLATHIPFKGTESYKAYMVAQNNPDFMRVVNSWLAVADKENFAANWGIKLTYSTLAAENLIDSLIEDQIEMKTEETQIQPTLDIAPLESSTAPTQVDFTPQVEQVKPISPLAKMKPLSSTAL